MGAGGSIRALCRPQRGSLGVALATEIDAKLVLGDRYGTSLEVCSDVLTVFWGALFCCRRWVSILGECRALKKTPGDPFLADGVPFLTQRV